MNIILLLFGHYLGDYLFQTKKMAKGKKERNMKYFLAHCLVYFISVLACSIFWGDIVSILLIACFIGFSHFIVDGIKIFASDKHELLLYMIDQFVHIAIIIAISHFMQPVNIVGKALYSYFVCTFPDFPPIKTGIIILAYLFCMQPTGFAIRILLSYINPNKSKDKSEKKSKKESKKISKEESEDASKEKEQATPKIDSSLLIGILERICTLTLILLNQYAAIAYVIAAKSLGRINFLIKDDGFADKYIVGTLLSIIISIFCGCLILLFFN